MIAPFWADVDTSNAGTLWFRVSTAADLLERAGDMIHTAFVRNNEFAPSLLLIATWDGVGYYEEGTDKVCV